MVAGGAGSHAGDQGNGQPDAEGSGESGDCGLRGGRFPRRRSTMKVLWCWRCKANVPMLDDDEWKIVWDAYSSVKNRDGRPSALAEYERLTGYKETNFNALFDHRISRDGLPCSNCGKVLRTRIAYKCFECGFQIH